MILALENAANQTSIAGKCGIEAAVAAMSAHRSSEKAQLYGCYALNAITLSDTNIQRKAKNTPRLNEALNAAKARFPAVAEQANKVIERLAKV